MEPSAADGRRHGAPDRPPATEEKMVPAPTSLPDSRVRLFRLLQVVVAVGVTLLAVVVALLGAAPSFPILYWGGLGLMLAVGVASFLLPERAPPWTVNALVLVDIVGMSLAQAGLIRTAPILVPIATLPVLWLAVSMYERGPWLAIGASVSAWLLPYALVGRWPSEIAVWALSSVTPGSLVAMSIVANFAANALRRNERRLAQSHAAAAEALRESEDGRILLEDVLNALDEAVSVYDADRNLRVANSAARRVSAVLGMPADRPFDVDGLVSIREVGSQVPVIADPDRIRAAIGGEGFTRRLIWVDSETGRLALSTSARRIHRADGSLIGTILVSADVTEVAELQQLREDFLKTASHELRTPMTPLIAHLELLDDALADAPDAVRDRIHIIQRNADRLLDRIAELVAAADADVEVRVRPVDWDAAVAAAVDRAMPAAEAHPVCILREPADTGLVQLDPGRLGQALDEVLENAVMFSPPGATVRVWAWTTADAATIEIEDDGPGMTAEERARAFDRFYRAPAARAEAIPGFGLGLTTARSIVHAHGGSIALGEAPGGERV